MEVDKADWLIFCNQNKMMIVFDVYEKDVQTSVAHYNMIGRIKKEIFSYKKVKVTVEEI